MLAQGLLRLLLQSMLNSTVEKYASPGIFAKDKFPQHADWALQMRVPLGIEVIDVFGEDKICNPMNTPEVSRAAEHLVHVLL